MFYTKKIVFDTFKYKRLITSLTLTSVNKPDLECVNASKYFKWNRLPWDRIEKRWMHIRVL